METGGIERVKELTDDKLFIGFSVKELEVIKALANIRACNLEAVSPRELEKNPLMKAERKNVLPVYQEVVRKISDQEVVRKISDRLG